MKANAVKANAIPPQPDETFFPSARTKAALSAVPSDDQTKKTRDRERVPSVRIGTGERASRAHDSLTSCHLNLLRKCSNNSNPRFWAAS